MNYETYYYFCIYYYLQGTDPQKMKLIKKLHLAYKKLLQFESTICAKDQEIYDWKEKLEETRIEMSRLPTKEEMDKLWVVQQDLKNQKSQLQVSIKLN